MIRRLLAIAFIFLCTSAAWGVLGGTLFARTYGSDDGLRSKVESTWGTRQAQHAPTATYVVERTRVEESLVDGKAVSRTSRSYETRSLPLVASDVAATVKLDHRQKGLLWYATYTAEFDS